MSTLTQELAACGPIWRTAVTAPTGTEQSLYRLTPMAPPASELIQLLAATMVAAPVAFPAGRH